jgi:hypothetical protein
MEGNPLPSACLLCGDDSERLTKEHVFGEWIAQYIDTKGTSTRQRFKTDWQTGREETDVAHTMPLRLDQWEVRCLCKVCNNEWGSRLEGRMKRFAGPLIDGTAATLTVEQATTLATWACRAMLVHGLFIGTGIDVPVVPSSIRNENRPPVASEGVTLGVWILTSDATGPWKVRARQKHGHLNSRAYEVSSEPKIVLPDDTDIFLATFGLEHLVIVIFGTTLDIPVNDLATLAPDKIARVWPNPAEVAWPMPPVGKGEIDILYERFGAYVHPLRSVVI